MKNTKKLVFAGLFAALACIATIIVKIDLPGGGYFNLGDCIVITAGVILGPYFGFGAAAIGTALADVFLGAAVYAPATFIIKGLMALVVGLLYMKNKKLIISALGAVIAEIIMVAGYFVYEIFLARNIAAAALGIPGNLLQGAVGLVSSVVLIALLTKNKAINKFFTE